MNVHTNICENNSDYIQVNYSIESICRGSNVTRKKVKCDD